MPKKVFIGIDTSNYTTSFAICDFDGNILKNHKILLPVKEGTKGLRQSDAVFAHIKNLPIIAQKIREDNESYEVIAVGHSAFPRDVDGSYMPCFLVGEALSEILASLYNVKNYRFSHQAGHVMAAEYSSKAEFEGDFLAFHISGGTTEILYVKQVNNGYNIKLIGGSCDLHAGQAIDRIGVRMGLSFPCGTKIEELAKENTQNIPNFRISVNGLECNLSGLENIACKLLESNDNSLVAAFTINFISRTIEKLTENLRIEYPDLPIVFAGGVMSNIIIQNNIKAMFKKVYFAKPEFSSDNACGISLLTRKKHFNEEGYND